jgi:anti-sigma B factor antagonist
MSPEAVSGTPIEEQIGDVLVIRVPSETFGADSADEIHKAIDRGVRKIVVNLRRAGRINSAGNGELVGAYTHAFNRGGKMVLAEVPPKIYDVLVLTQLADIYEIFKTEQEAIDALQKEPIRQL